MEGRAYHPAFGTEVAYTFQTLPESADGQVAATIQRMIQYIQEDSKNPVMLAEARRALELGGGDPIAGVWRIAKEQMRFQKDTDTAAQLQINDERKEDAVEVLIRPVDQARMIATRGEGVEDCDGFEVYAGCILTICGIPCSFVTVAADPEEPRNYSHVYMAAYPEGKRIPLDFSHGPRPGWECPNLGRLKEWPISQTWSSRAATALIALGILIGGYFALKEAA